MLHTLVGKVRQWFTAFFGLRWVRFGIVGAISTAIYAAFGIAFNWWNWPVLVGNATAYVLSFVFSYLAQRKWTFQSKLPHAQLLPKYAALQLAGLGLNSAIIVVLMYVGLPYVIAMGIAIVLVPFFVYIVNKVWVFRTPKPPQTPVTPS